MPGYDDLNGVWEDIFSDSLHKELREFAEQESAARAEPVRVEEVVRRAVRDYLHRKRAERGLQNAAVAASTNADGTARTGPHEIARQLQLVARRLWAEANVNFLRRTPSGACLFRVYRAAGEAHYLGLAGSICGVLAAEELQRRFLEEHWLVKLSEFRPNGLLVTDKGVARWNPMLDKIL